MYAPRRDSWLWRLLLWALCLVAVFVATDAWAWVDVTLVADDIRLEVGQDGTAVVDHAITLRVRGGPMRTFDLAGVDLDAVFEGEASVEAVVKEHSRPEKNKEAQVVTTKVGSIRVHMQPDGSARLTSDDGLSRGTFMIRFRYKTDLVKKGALRRDGSMVRLEWAGPKWPNGVDTAKCTVSVVSAPTEPRPLSDPNNADDPEASTSARGSAGVFLSTLKRQGERDDLELIRPHVARGESVLWSARLDAKSIPAVADPKVKPAAATVVRSVLRNSQQERRVYASVALGVALLFVALMGIKTHQVSEACERAGVLPRPLVPMPSTVRPMAAGLLVAAGISVQLFIDPPWVGSVVLVGALAVMAFRTPVARPVARGPGRWLALKEDEAFGKPVRHRNTWLDASTRSGVIGALIAAVIVSGATVGVFFLSPYHAALTALDGLVLMSLFFTGRQAELPPSLVNAHAEELREIRDLLHKEEPSFRVVPWARFAEGESDPDELRLMVMPKTPMRGLTSIEVAYSHVVGMGGYAKCPEVLVRVTEDSAAEERARELLPEARWLNGRKEGERVAQVEPTIGSITMTTTLVRRLGRRLAETPRKAESKVATTQVVKDGVDACEWASCINEPCIVIL